MTRSSWPKTWEAVDRRLEEGVQEPRREWNRRRMRQWSIPKTLGIHTLQNSLTSEGMKRREEVEVLNDQKVGSEVLRRVYQFRSFQNLPLLTFPSHELTACEPSCENVRMAWRIRMSFGTFVVDYKEGILSKFQPPSCTMSWDITDASREVVHAVGAWQGSNPRCTVAERVGRITSNLDGK